MNDFQVSNLLILLERIAKALEDHNRTDVEFKDPHGDIVQTAEQTERLIQVQERQADVAERNATSWEEHNRWHAQSAGLPENHPQTH